MLYWRMGDYAKAETFSQQALEIRGEVLGKRHHLYACSLNNLAMLYTSMGEHAKSEPLFKETLDIVSKALGAGHPNLAMTLDNLGLLYLSMGRYEEAAQPLHQALEGVKRAYGDSHFFVATPLNCLARLAAATGSFGDALERMKESRAIVDKHTRLVLSTFPEPTRLAQLRANEEEVDRLLSLIVTHLKRAPEAVVFGARTVLRSKGLSLEYLAREREATAASGDPTLEARAGRLNTLRSRYARVSLTMAGQADQAMHQERLRDLEKQIESVESAFARRSGEFAAAFERREASLAAVASALPGKAVLVDYVRPRIFDFKSNRWGAARYVAFVMQHTGAPKMIDLGDADRIDGAVRAMRREVTVRVRETDGEESSATARVRALGQRLYRQVLRPLEAHLASASQLILSPAGELNLVPFEALVDGEGRWAIERWRISYVTTGRDLLSYERPLARVGKTALIVAAPDFDLAGERRVTMVHKVSNLREASGSTKIRDLEGMQFEPLPGTRTEAEELRVLLTKARGFAADVRLGEEALEEAVKAAQSPRVLHIATHGFFLADRGTGGPGARGMGGVAGPFAGSEGSLSAPVANPLLRSGLAFAGANQPTDATGIEDGILTAYEASGPNLWRTRLVVLSACETGLGEVVGSEGVFGLRRAFLSAGARSLLTSLWTIPDAETATLMARFYTRWLSGKRKVDALRQTQLDIIRERRSARAGAHPHFWAGFVLLGDWRR